MSQRHNTRLPPGRLATLAGSLLLALAACGEAQRPPDNTWHAVVLLYHHVGTETPASTSITPEQFRAHLDWLAASATPVVPLADIIAAVRGEGQVPPGAVAITFDDGYASIHDTAWPELSARGLPFTVFLNSAAHGASRQGLYLSWPELQAMAKAGVAMANHSASHPHLPLLPPGQLEAELRGSQQVLRQHLPEVLPAHAYPYGEWTNAARTTLAALGMVGFGQQSGAIGPHSDPLNLPRFAMGSRFGDLADFALKTATLPLPVLQQAALPDQVLQHGTPPPVLELTLADNFAGPLQCFATGQGGIPVQDLGNNRWRVQASGPLPAGRSRYNCTAPAAVPPVPAPDGSSQGRFRWFGWQWLVIDGWQPD